MRNEMALLDLDGLLSFAERTGSFSRGLVPVGARPAPWPVVLQYPVAAAIDGLPAHPVGFGVFSLALLSLGSWYFYLPTLWLTIGYVPARTRLILSHSSSNLQTVKHQLHSNPKRASLLVPAFGSGDHSTIAVRLELSVRER